jgi:hypothetical protein
VPEAQPASGTFLSEPGSERCLSRSVRSSSRHRASGKCVAFIAEARCVEKLPVALGRIADRVPVVRNEAIKQGIERNLRPLGARAKKLARQREISLTKRRSVTRRGPLVRSRLDPSRPVVGTWPGGLGYAALHCMQAITSGSRCSSASPRRSAHAASAYRTRCTGFATACSASRRARSCAIASWIASNKSCSRTGLVRNSTAPPFMARTDIGTSA